MVIGQQTLQLVTSAIAFYITSVVSIFGIVGNVLSLFVLRRMTIQQRQCQLFTILSALCAVDAVFILCNFVLNVLTMLYEYHQVASILAYYCYLQRGHIVKWVAPVCFTMQQASIYLTLLVSLERWTAVCRPLTSATSKSSSRTMWRNVGCVLLLCFAYNTPRFFETVVEELWIDADVESDRKLLVENSQLQFGCFHAKFLNSTCRVFKFGQRPADWLAGNGTSVYAVTYHGVLYTVFYFLLPVLIITYMNARIVQSLRHSLATWQPRRQEKETQLTYVSLAIVLSFYVFMLPNVLLTVADIVWQPKRESMQLAIVTTNFLVLINSCLNFILYCVIGKRFRRSLQDLVRCKREPANQSVAGDLANQNADCSANQNAARPASQEAVPLGSFVTKQGGSN